MRREHSSPVAARVPRARPAALLVIAGAFAVGAACDWRKFDDEAERAPVKNIGKPSSYAGKDFGRVLLPLNDGLGASAAFVASSLNNVSLVWFTIDSKGGIRSAGIPVTPNLDAFDESGATALAEVPGGEVGHPTVLAGVAKLKNVFNGQAFTLKHPDGTAVPLGTPRDTGSGRAVAAGPVMAPAAAGVASDYVVASDAGLTVLVGGSAVAFKDAPAAGGCDPSFDPTNLEPRYVSRRALVLGALADAGVPGTVQIASGSPKASAAAFGTVSLFGVAAAGGELACLGTVTGTKPLFGASLATGDFNADGVADLLVGAPPRQAVVYLGPFPAGFATPLAIDNPQGVDFGYAVTALNVDGVAGDEALVGDPGATEGGQVNAGRIVAYKHQAGGTMVQYKAYADTSPGADARYGTSVHALRFCPTPAGAATPVTTCTSAEAARILLVGGNDQVFVYYTVGDNLPLARKDVRQE